MAVIIADTREREGANTFLESIIAENNKYYKNEPNISFKIEQITTGDYCIMLKNNETQKFHYCMIIERKTWKDLAASIKDNRMNSQLNSMMDFKKKNVQILYLIEGSFSFSDDRKIGNIPFKNLHAKIRHNIIRGIPSIQSRSQLQSAKIIVNFARDFIKMYTKKEIELSDEALDLDIKQTKIQSDSDIYLQMWNCIPKIAMNSAVVLHQNFHISEIICANKTNFNEIKEKLMNLTFNDGKRFGNKSSYIMELAYNGDNEEQKKKVHDISLEILQQIPGISKEVSETILEKYTLRSICNGFTLVENIEQLQTSGKHKIGQKRAQKIINLLIKPELLIH